jgi:hypothetical protein
LSITIVPEAVEGGLVFVVVELVVDPVVPKEVLDDVLLAVLVGIPSQTSQSSISLVKEAPPATMPGIAI